VCIQVQRSSPHKVRGQIAHAPRRSKPIVSINAPSPSSTYLAPKHEHFLPDNKSGKDVLSASTIDVFSSPRETTYASSPALAARPAIHTSPVRANSSRAWSILRDYQPRSAGKARQGKGRGGTYVVKRPLAHPAAWSTVISRFLARPARVSGGVRGCPPCHDAAPRRVPLGDRVQWIAFVSDVAPFLGGGVRARATRDVTSSRTDACRPSWSVSRGVSSWFS
jgi:hypothetical protein